MHGNQNPVAHGKLLNRGSDRRHRADGLVAEDAAFRYFRHVTTEDVQIGSADRDGVDAHDRVGGFLDDRIGHLLPRALAWPMVNGAPSRATSFRSLSDCLRCTAFRFPSRRDPADLLC